MRSVDLEASKKPLDVYMVLISHTLLSRIIEVPYLQ